MKNEWYKMQLLGVLLIIFVLWDCLILYPSALLTKPPSEVIPYCKFALFIAPKMMMRLPLGSVSTNGIAALVRGSRPLLKSLFFIEAAMSLLILASGIGLLIKRKEAVKLTLYTALAFVVLNGLNLILLAPTIVHAVRAYKALAVARPLKQIIFTLLFTAIAYYLTRPRVREQFK